jgi:hypothetical protein
MKRAAGIACLLVLAGCARSYGDEPSEEGRRLETLFARSTAPIPASSALERPDALFICQVLDPSLGVPSMSYEIRETYGADVPNGEITKGSGPAIYIVSKKGEEYLILEPDTALKAFHTQNCFAASEAAFVKGRDGWFLTKLDFKLPP